VGGHYGSFKGDLMFDDKITTFWHSKSSKGDRGVKVVFKDNVKFSAINFRTRDKCCNDRYKRLCIRIDGKH